MLLLRHKILSCVTNEISSLLSIVDMVRGGKPTLWREESGEIHGGPKCGDTHTLCLLKKTQLLIIICDVMESLAMESLAMESLHLSMYKTI